jgi:BirA family transcriptional regulator, biotin operon repressor / biotin---[acetyl-CoA-carboxylase] ligase
VEDSLSPEVVGPLLEGRFGDRYLYEPETESTQLLLADAELPEGAVAATEHQTAGRGRVGRRWTDEPGASLLLSLLLRPPGERRAPELSLVAALATAEALEEAAGVQARIKWPNDVLLDGRKVAGILAEMRGGAVVLGIGINVNQSEAELDPHARFPAASLLTASGQAHDRARLLASLLARLEDRYDAWAGSGLAPLRARDFLRGRAVTVDGLAGIACGIHASGALELEAGGERRLVESGEVALSA